MPKHKEEFQSRKIKANTLKVRLLTEKKGDNSLMKLWEFARHESFLYQRRK